MKPWSFAVKSKGKHLDAMQKWPRRSRGTLVKAMIAACIEAEMLYSACVPHPQGGFYLCASTHVFDRLTCSPQIVTVPALKNAVPSLLNVLAA